MLLLLLVIRVAGHHYYASVHGYTHDISLENVTCLHHSMTINITRCYCTQVFSPCVIVQASVHYQSINLRPTQVINITTYYTDRIEHITRSEILS